MNVCAILRFKDSKKSGYIAILAPNSVSIVDNTEEELLNILKTTKCDFYVYFGTDFGNDFNEISPRLLNYLHKAKTVRRRSDFSIYIKSFNPNIMISPVEESGIIFDVPYIYNNGDIIAEWTPLFDRDLKDGIFQTVSEGAIVQYIKQQQIFISTLIAKRHTPALNSEVLMIDRFTNIITRSYSYAEATKYVNCKQHTENGKWKTDLYEELEISGYKLR
jgi:hypothetical protein